MLLSLKAGGTGLNLTAADHVFLLDPWWNPAVEDQAADRAHRIGQDKPVFIHRLIAEDTVEDWHVGPGTHPGEFRAEIREPDGDAYFGFDVTFCAECHLYGQFGAMDLMPYMCATDDYDTSQAPGLRRTGTIALGHDRCDFRYQRGDTPPTLAELFPERIRSPERGA